MGMSLLKFYESVHRPRFLVGRRAAVRTIEVYDRSVRLWCELMGNTSLKRLGYQQRGSLLIAEWMSEIAQRRNPHGELVQPATVNCHRRSLLVVLNRARVLGFLASVPFSEPLRTPIRVPRFVSERDVSRCYRACRHARYPSGVKAPDWWRAFIVVAWNVGLRRGTLLRLPTSAVDFERQEIRVAAEITKGRREQVIPMNEAVSRHLMRLAMSNDSELVFPWPHTFKTFYLQWNRIQDAAGVNPHFKLHDLRRTCATQLQKLGQPGSAQAMLGHTDFRTTATHYICWPEVLRSVVDRMPQPRAFLR